MDGSLNGLASGTEDQPMGTVKVGRRRCGFNQHRQTRVAMNKITGIATHLQMLPDQRVNQKEKQRFPNETKQKRPGGLQTTAESGNPDDATVTDHFGLLLLPLAFLVLADGGDVVLDRLAAHPGEPKAKNTVGIDVMSGETKT